MALRRLITFSPDFSAVGRAIRREEKCQEHGSTEPEGKTLAVSRYLPCYPSKRSNHWIIGYIDYIPPIKANLLSFETSGEEAGIRSKFAKCPVCCEQLIRKLSKSLVYLPIHLHQEHAALRWWIGCWVHRELTFVKPSRKCYHDKWLPRYVDPEENKTFGNFLSARENLSRDQTRGLDSDLCPCGFLNFAAFLSSVERRSVILDSR